MYQRLDDLIDVKKLQDKNILLVGVGGVGSASFEVLIRSGISNITIIDFDEYEPSNLNRQLNSSKSTIGKKKVEVLKKHALDINSDINVSVIDEFLNKSSDIDFKRFDYIIDACDDIEAKVFLIKKSMEFNIPIIVSLGVGNRINPLKLGITRLDKTEGDPLAKKLRNALRKENISLKVNVVSSCEIPIKKTPVSSFISVSLATGNLCAYKCIMDLLNC